VNARRHVAWRLASVAWLAACVEAEAPALTVGPVAFTEDELLGLTESRRDALVGLTALALAVADSTTDELGAPLVDAWADEILIEILAAELTLEKHAVEDEVLQARYAMDPDWELTVRHLLVYSDRWRPEPERDAARAKAERGLEMLRSGSFPAVAAALADEGGADVREGTMPPGREGTWVPEFWAAALALQPDELSPVTETQYGFHVLRLLERTQVPFEEARSLVARSVARTLEDPRAVLDEWAIDLGSDAPSRRAAAIEETLARGIVATTGERAGLLRRWETDVLSWSTALGFTYGVSPQAAGAAALAALARPDQRADIARRELTAHAELLRAHYPVTSGTPLDTIP
jgi:hypothetical protein